MKSKNVTTEQQPYNEAVRDLLEVLPKLEGKEQEKAFASLSKTVKNDKVSDDLYPAMAEATARVARREVSHPQKKNPALDFLAVLAARENGGEAKVALGKLYQDNIHGGEYYGGGEFSALEIYESDVPGTVLVLEAIAAAVRENPYVYTEGNINYFTSSLEVNVDWSRDDGFHRQQEAFQQLTRGQKNLRGAFNLALTVQGERATRTLDALDEKGMRAQKKSKGGLLGRLFG